MSSSGKLKPSHHRSNENVKRLFTTSQNAMGCPRQTLQVLQQSAGNKAFGKSAQAGKIVPKRKQCNAEYIRGPKRVKAEVKATQTEETPCLSNDLSNDAYQLMVLETPPSAYWKAIADERQKALYNVLQENEKLHKDIEAKDDQITQLKCENAELQELAQHVQYMADMIERLTGASPESLEDMREIALDVEEDGEDDRDDINEAEDSYSECDLVDEEEASDHERAGPSGEQD